MGGAHHETHHDGRQMGSRSGRMVWQELRTVYKGGIPKWTMGLCLVVTGHRVGQTLPGRSATRQPAVPSEGSTHQGEGNTWLQRAFPICGKCLFPMKHGSFLHHETDMLKRMLSPALMVSVVLLVR